VLDGDRCFPAYTRRRSDSGREVRTERSVVRFCMERSCETVKGIVWPDTFLTNICMVSAASSTSGELDRVMGLGERILRIRSEVGKLRASRWKGDGF